ncbi:hypothetical protein [Salinibacterium sp. M195]|uniref:hypothetical protein n=1 Tax=Salinibacterium sp. M195 TaxID=2583374 RepID=UPI001C633FA1|nr:hypothetical protein [Salinibacterium sp. M195]QYH34906.1 hypothetical protein FFT87_02485 [Salinibacterium sp. M195]
MSDELIVSGGGSYSIATDEMLSSASELQRAADMTRDIAGSIRMVDDRLTVQQMESWGVPAGAVLVEDDLNCAFGELQVLANRAEELSGIVRFAAHTYGWVENLSEAALRKLSADAAALLGFLFPLWSTALLRASPIIPLLAGIGVGFHVLGGRDRPLLTPEQLSTALNELISDPTFVLALRHGVMSADEFAAGAAGIPPDLVSALSAAGLIGLGTSAGLVQGAGGLGGVLKETPVTQVSKTTPVPVSAPQGSRDRVDRIPQPTQENPEQIRIERYELPGGEEHFEVYVAGTQDFALSGTAEPWDFTSNISNAVGRNAASVAAVEAAMRDAGITEGSSVGLNGYSQGAAVAARIAASGEYNVSGLFTIGGPIGQIPVPPDVETIVVEHTDDVVPATGGLQDNANALVVQREAFGGRSLPEGQVVPAHQHSEYAETARLMDESGSEEIQNATRRLSDPTNGATSATVTEYSYARVQP